LIGAPIITVDVENAHRWLQLCSLPWNEIKQKWDATFAMELHETYKMYPSSSESFFQELVTCLHY
jgi:hypothetical protein